MKQRIDISTPPRSESTFQHLKQAVRSFFFDYCSNTTIHGVRYFAERKRHWTERCWWIIAIILAMWFCSSSIQKVWIKWRNNPVIMKVNERMLPIPTIPFPTVTICPEVKTHKEKVDLSALFGVEREKWNVSEIELFRLNALTHLCTDLHEPFIGLNENFVNASVYDVIEDIAPTLNETLLACDWPYQGDLCAELFAPILTEEGLCFVFNALNSIDVYTDNMTPERLGVWDRPNVTDWSPEDGYCSIADRETYPIRVYSARDSGALKLTLRSENKDVEYVCRTLTPGFKIFFHSPGNAFRKADTYVRVGFSEAVDVSFKPKLITTSNELRDYSPDQRQCFFNSERQLHFYKFYSQANCQQECIANYTLLQCGCVTFSLPRNESTKICGSSMISCYRDAYQTLFGEDIIDGLSNEDAKRFRLNCNCLPACMTVSYEVDIDRTKFDWKDALKKLVNLSTDELSKYHVSEVSLYFQHFEISSLRREEQYTYTDFLAVCGGLLGLCLGVSALSIIEFLYFSTLRLFWSLRKWKSENVVVPLKPTRINHIFIPEDDKILF